MFFQFMPNWNKHNKNECGDNNIMIVTHKYQTITFIIKGSN